MYIYIYIYSINHYHDKCYYPHHKDMLVLRNVDDLFELRPPDDDNNNNNNNNTNNNIDNGDDDDDIDIKANQRIMMTIMIIIITN